MEKSRWVLSRAGIFNFWLYDDEVFELSEGRILFRGANGSGKSVTMQSFLPLVLDGDKRPNRLDPFGSKDRKIEYYLLGEADSGIQDRTGYLYLEFVQPALGKYVTVGIGLRARRGAAQIGFWGFALTDQRRVGKDFFLYDLDTYEKYGKKVPLDRAELEAAIGDGGKVVREQGEYRALVNQLLFGFSDIEAYKDLLELLIQLRSPKLSKDFKPSTIYSILHNALPPLSDEELRPLSEVLEDMDEISDRLDELQIHRREAERLVHAYHQYNEKLLYDVSVQVTEAAGEKVKAEAALRQQEQEYQENLAQKQQAESSLQQAEAELAKIEKEIEYLNRSEAMEKQHELQVMSDRLREAEAERERSRRRLDALLAEKRRKEEQLAVTRTEMERHATEQCAILEEMDAVSGEIEFQEHFIYERQWRSDDRPEEERIWAAWREDVARYRKRLQDVHALCTEERKAAERVREAEVSFSVARERKDAAERHWQAKREELAQSVQRLEDALFHWYKQLRWLPVSEEAWRIMAQRLHQYPDASYEEIVEPVRIAWSQAMEAVQSEQVQANHERDQLKKEEDRLQAEWEAWKMYREPEPERTEARMRSRKRRLEAAQGKGVGAPLYAVCEFQPHVDEATRAVLESVLHRTGLLDAWISPEPVELLPDEEEMWIRPNPVWFGHTLADYLIPTPSAESGLSAGLIEEVLRTILIGDDSEQGGCSVTESGRFVLGPLSGLVAGKPCAEWIGAEARRETRKREMKRLEEALEGVSNQIALVEERLKQLAERAERMKQEKDALPSDAELRAAYRAVQDAQAELDHAVRVEEEWSEKWKQATGIWQELKKRLLEETSQWSRLKQELDFREALSALYDYERLGGELKSSLVLTARIRAERNWLAEELDALAERIAHEEEGLAACREREREYRAAVEALTRLLQEMGAYDLFRRLDERKREAAEGKKAIEAYRNDLMDIIAKLSACEERLTRRKEELADREAALQRAMTHWQREWNLKLVAFPADHPLATTHPDTPQAVLRTAETIRQTYRSRYENRKREQLSQQLQETFAMVKNTLLEYSLESRYDEETDRLFIESMRDRTQPWTPMMLLVELRRLEEEQRLLIDAKDRELYEEILIRSVGRAIKEKINRAERWVEEMNRFMESRQTSSGLVLSLEWIPRAAQNERELDTEKLVKLLRKNPAALLPEEIEQMVEHFRSRIRWAKEDAEEGESLRRWIQELLDYRGWFSFRLYYRKGSHPWRELTDSRFNVLSGGEKAMAMYIPLFAATDSRYKDSRESAPRLISLDEAFAGVDEENIQDMFRLLTEMEFSYMMTSQVLWGCYETVPSLSIYELHRPLDAPFVTLIPYYWNGHRRRMVVDGDWDSLRETAAAGQPKR